MLHVPLLDRFGDFEKSVGQGGFSVVDVGDNAEISNVFSFHGIVSWLVVLFLSFGCVFVAGRLYQAFCFAKSRKKWYNGEKNTYKNACMNWGRLLKNSVLGVSYVLALSVVAAYLFFPEGFSQGKEMLKAFLGSPQEGVVAEKSLKELRIGLVQYPDTLEPTSLDESVRTLALQVYEPLVKTNRYLKPEPALALSWGRISPTVWRFELRPNVIFHDNRPLTVDDVAASFRRAANYKNSDIKSMVRGMSIEPKSGNIFQIRTEKPDPLLLQKISMVLILPKEYEQKSSFAPIGTGAYRFLATKPQISFIFDAFSSYWGSAPTYHNLMFLFYSRRDDREKALINSDVDVATHVPPESVQKLTDASFDLNVLPSLEVNFLAFNVQDKHVFHDPTLRRAVQLALDKKTFVDFALGYATAASQYVGSGVFGFNPKIPDAVYDIKQASILVKRVSSFDLIPIKLTFVKGLETAGEYIKTQLRTIGFDPQLSYLSWEDFRDGLSSGGSDLSFFGWKSDIGSASDFFMNAVHTRNTEQGTGLFNAGGYSNSTLDGLIEQSSQEFDSHKRLKAYQGIMEKVVTSLYGVPLFESQTIYASNSKIKFQPRIDGYILASDIH